MNKNFKYKKLLAILLFQLVSMTISAQITGVVTDAQTGDTLLYPSASYKGNHVAVSGDAHGRYTIERHNGWYLTFSAVGYQSKRILIDAKTPSRLDIKLKPDSKQLNEVVVKEKRSKYSRKDNPAVELMRRVIAAKKRTDLKNHDFYQYDRYQKITLAMNDINPFELLDEGAIGKRKWLLDQVETCPYNGKLILPLSVDETVSKHLYRRDPKDEVEIVRGINSTGINHFIQTGDILNTILQDFFTDIDIYEDQIRLLHHQFTSPISKDAISFYRFYIEDTVFVDRDLCYHLQFIPNNQQDFGFRGELFILADSTLHVKRCDLTLPQRTDVNFVENMQVQQEYKRLPNGEWALSVDDMIVEMKVTDLISKAIVIRTTRLSDYDFSPISKQLFKGRVHKRHEADAMGRDEAFWNQYRTVELTKSESSMNAFIHRIEQLKGFKYVLFGLKALIENFVETSPSGKPSKFDIGPVNTTITRNFIDGFRFRLSGQTTANLNPHLFASGYVAYGLDSKKTYYKGELTYSFNKKEYLPRDFPKHALTFTSTYDVTSPSDRFIETDKDNVFTAFKWTKVDKMMFYNRQQLAYEREEEWGFKTTALLKTEENESTGSLPYFKMRTTEAKIELQLAPGRTFINTKQRRRPVNLEAPVFTLSHTMGFDGFLGGQYKYNFTEASIFKRFWMKSWGKIDVYAKAGAQWDQVPYPLLIMPAANLSYIIQRETFNLINNMEFLNDRYASLDVKWDMSGKIFNRVPLLKHLKWREIIGAKVLWGDLTSKNNPFLEENQGNSVLMPFPEGCNVMDPKKPYVEVIAGVHNIFKILHVEYVRRLTYNDLPTAHKHGVRLMLHLAF